MRTGITVMSDFILSEGPEAVLDAIVGRARATAVTINPTVTEPAADGEGSFQPPTDGGSSPRLFDRPLWGRYRLWVRSESSFVPDGSLYSGCAYAPRRAVDLTERYGPTIRRFIDLAHDAGLEVFFQIGAAAPSGLRDEDRPRGPDGVPPANPMARTASLASSAVRGWYRAYLTDLVHAYPDIDGIRVDWPEYPCYTIGEAFVDFHPAVAAWALGRIPGDGERDLSALDLRAMAADIGRLRSLLTTGLTDATLRDWIRSTGGGAPIEHLQRRFPALQPWLYLKRALAADYLRFLRSVIDDAGGQRIALAPNAFPPPFSILTGLPFASLAGVAPWVGVKLYTMHWLQIVRFWTDEIVSRTPNVSPALVAEALMGLFDVGDALPRPIVADQVRYPEPDEPHAESDASQQRKLAQAAIESTVPVEPIVHGYGPIDDFTRRLRAAAAAGPERVWVNRYGYLSDAKLEAIGRIAGEMGSGR